MRMKVIVDEFRNALKALRGEITKPLQGSGLVTPYFAEVYGVLRKAFLAAN
jgi:hypothetical protein